MQRKDWALLLLAAAGGETLTPVQLQKTAYLLLRAHPEVGNGYYVFRHYDYGAFSVDIYRDAELLEQDGYADIQINQFGQWKEYRATTGGIEHADQLKHNISPDIARYIQETVDWARNKSFQELVRAVYERYPETKENSIFQD